jgi:hypothetical protein
MGEETTTPLAISDEDFLNQDNSAFETDEIIPETEDKTDDDKDKETDALSDQTDDDKTSDDDKSKEDSEAQEQTPAETDTDQVSHPEGDTQTEHETSGKDDAKESLDTSEKDSPDTKGDTPDTKEFDYKSAFKKVSEPFKANGVDMQVKDPEDMIRLMQMGANYQQKMAKIKPNLKIVSMLEKHGLLDEAKINNLIDLSKKDPKAVAKLIEESGIDPADIDKDVPTDYKATNYAVGDKEFELDQVLDEIKSSPTFNKTINVLTKEWDKDSKTAVSDNPSIIGIIDTHMQNGVYDKVNAMMQNQKALGKMDGISDVDGYHQIAAYMQKEGMLHDKSKDPKDTSDEVSSKPKAKSKADAERDNKRKAVAPVKGTSGKKGAPETDFLGLSDEDFMKKYAVR